MNAMLHDKLPGLDRDRVLAAIEPVLRAHNVEGVELRWRTDHAGWLLELTIERPGSRIPGDGVTVDLCGEISRDISAALDVADVIGPSYRLEVGSPGLDRALYVPSDYERFAGQVARLKLKEPIGSDHVIRGTLHGLDAGGSVLIDTDRGEIGVAFENIDKAQLLFDWASKARPGKGPGRNGAGAKNGARHKRGR
jgi:ribosome maturation factor RimP